MKPLLFLAASALAVATAACTPPHPAPRAALDCPAKSGPLVRTGVSPDRKTCTYANNEGDEVSLRLLPVSAGPETALKGVEDELTNQYAPAPAAAPASTDKTPVKTTADQADAAAAQAGEDAGDWDEADGRRRGRRHGDTTRIDLPGIHIRADGDKGAADVRVGAIQVHANEGGAVVRVAHDVRLRGDMLSPERRGFRASYRLSDDRLKDGYQAVGYEAAGPRTGPLTVGVIKSKIGEHHGVFTAVNHLVRKNGGV